MDTPRYPIFWNDSGRPFRLRIVRKGDRYGLNCCKVHDQDDPLVEFYDASYGPEDGFGPLGQFTGSRYCLSTLIGKGTLIKISIEGLPLDLCGDVEAWTVDGSVTSQVMRWVRHELARVRVAERFELGCEERCSPMRWPLTDDDEVDDMGRSGTCPRCGECYVCLRLVP
jgi:hypothetical protein